MKKIIAILLVWMLVKPIAVQAGVWEQYRGENARYQDDKGSYVSDQWKQIDGKWYYFDLWWLAKNTWVENYYVDSDGAMLTNTVTPDGYQVGDDGFCLGKEKAEIRSSNLTAFKALFQDELNEIFNVKCGFERVFIMDYKNTDMTADEKARIMNPCYELLLFSRKEDMRCKYMKDVLTDGELYIYRKQDVVDIMQDLYGVETTQEDLLALQANADKVDGDRYYIMYPSWGEGNPFSLGFPQSIDMEEDHIILKGSVFTYGGENVASYVGTFKRNEGSCLYDYSFDRLIVTE